MESMERLDSIDLLVLSSGGRRELFQGVLRELEVVLLGLHLKELKEALNERLLEPVLPLHVSTSLLQTQQTGRKGVGYSMGANECLVHVRHGLVQGDRVLIIHQEPVHLRKNDATDRPALFPAASGRMSLSQVAAVPIRKQLTRYSVLAFET